MTDSKQKSFKAPFIISVVIILILGIYLIVGKSSLENSTAKGNSELAETAKLSDQTNSELNTVSASVLEKSVFAGVWTIDSENDKFEINNDGSYELFIHGSQMRMKGHFELIDAGINNEKTTILLLKNETPTTGSASYPEDKYYKFYMFSVDKIINGQIFLTDLSGETVARRNGQYTLKRK